MKGIRIGALVAAFGMGVFAWLAPAAGAASVSKYHPSGWQGSVEYGPGQCVQDLNCPTVTNTRHTGKTPFLRTKIEGRAGFAATSRGIWRSSPFRYSGAKGKAAQRLTVAVTRRAHVEALLNGTDNAVNYTVELLRLDNGLAIAPIDHRKVREAKDWTRLTVNLRPRSLKLGHQYAVRLTTEFQTGSQLFPDAWVDYFPPVIRAAFRGRKRHHHHHHHRPPAAGSRLLRIKVPCARKYRPGKCRVRTIALRRRHGRPIARPGHARIRAGHRKVVTMRVRRPYRRWVKKHNRVLVRERVRVHGHIHRFYRHYRIVHR